MRRHPSTAPANGPSSSSITVPLITPVIFYNLITQLCQAFQEFNGPFSVPRADQTARQPLISMLIYNNAFIASQDGYGERSGMGTVPDRMTLTGIAFVSQKNWVYYSDEDGR